MGIHQLKARAYALAEVDTTRQLRAVFPAIAPLNLRLKSSWERVVAVLETRPTLQTNALKPISELRSEVYGLAQVSTTQQLKAKYESLRAFNFSFKAAWVSALDQLTSTQTNFQTWLTQPPPEYKALFAEIEAITEDFDTQLNQAKRLGQEAHNMAKNLDQLAQEAATEATNLRREADLASQVAHQAQLN